jgi:hypothetical protein
VGNAALRQRHQCQRAALAVIIRAQQDQDIFERHHDNERPQDQGKHPEHGLRGRGPAGSAGRCHGFAQRI